jgi:hypothetical protein
MALKKFTQLTEAEFNLVFQTWEDCYEYLLGIQKVSLISKSEKCPECGQVFTRETLNKRKTCTGKYVLSHKLERGTGDCCGKNILSPKLYFFANVKKEITSKDRDESGKPIKKIVEKTIYPFNTRYDSQLLGVFKIIWGILTGNLPQYETSKGIEVEMKRFWIIKEDSDIITPKEFFVKVQEIIQYKNALNNTEFMGVVRSNIISPEIPTVTAPSTVATASAIAAINPEAEYEPPKGLSEQASKIHKMVYKACSRETDITRKYAIKYAGYMALVGLKKVSSTFEENISEKVLREMPGFSSITEIDSLSSICYTSFTMCDSDSIVDKLIPQPKKVVENKVILSIELDEIFYKSPKRDFGKKEFFWTISDFKAVVQEQLGFDLSEDQIERYFESKSK